MLLLRHAAATCLVLALLNVSTFIAVDASVQSLYGGVDQDVPDSSGEEQGDAVTDRRMVTLGVVVSFGVPGKIVGARYLKKSPLTDNEQPRRGVVYDQAGNLVASGVFADTGSELGWQYLTFTTPVSIVVGENYVVGYWTNSGYTFKYSAFDSGLTVGDISAPANAGVYKYDDYPTSIPNEVYKTSSYFADVSFVADDDQPLEPNCGEDCNSVVKSVEDSPVTATTTVSMPHMHVALKLRRHLCHD